MALIDQTVGQLAKEIAGATRVFDAYQLDFCCGGNHTLQQATSAAGIDPAPIVAELEALQKQAAADNSHNWSNADDAALVAHIINRYHAVHREQLPELIRLARRVEQVHGSRPNCPNGLADALHAMQQELESHMRKEEMVLFPMIEQGHGAAAVTPISVMREEHNDHGDALHRIEALTDGITTPTGACATWRALYTGLRAFREDLMNHIHTENNILFERFTPRASV